MTHGVVELLRCSQKHLPQPGSDKDSVVSSDCFLSPLHGMFSELLTRPLLARMPMTCSLVCLELMLDSKSKLCLPISCRGGIAGFAIFVLVVPASILG